MSWIQSLAGGVTLWFRTDWHMAWLASTGGNTWLPIQLGHHHCHALCHLTSSQAKLSSGEHWSHTLKQWAWWDSRVLCSTWHLIFQPRLHFSVFYPSPSDYRFLKIRWSGVGLRVAFSARNVTRSLLNQLVVITNQNVPVRNYNNCCKNSLAKP